MPWIERRHAETDVRLLAGEVRGLHARGAVPGLRRHPAQARDPRGHRRTAARSPRSRALSIGDATELAARRCELDRPGADDRRAGAQGDPRPARLPASTSACDYLSLDRPAATLAGGEAQRIRLATQIGSGLVGVLYVLDEPSIGLHQRDNHRLIETLVRLRDLGNTLIVVEHDEDTIRTADWVVDIGPGAGEHGGQIVVSGTGRRPAGQRASRSPAPTCPGAGRSRCRRSGGRGSRAASSSSRARASTTCATSTSRSRSAASSRSPACRGSGKSTLVNDILYAALANKINGARMRARAGTSGSRGVEQLDKVVGVDQSPIGRTPRSNPATYTGVFDHIRKLFARDHRGEDPRLPAGPVLVQRQGRPLRELRRRRHDQDRDELPAGRLRAVRGLQGRPVQPRDARGALQGQDDRRGAGHADRGGRRVLRGRSRRSPGTCDTLVDVGLGYVRLGPAGADAVRRRGAAGQARLRAAEALDRPHDLRARRADHRPALRGRPQAARRAAARWSTRATR